MSTTQLAKVLSNPYLTEIEGAKEALENVWNVMKELPFSCEVPNPNEGPEDDPEMIVQTGSKSKIDHPEEFPALQKAFMDHEEFWASVGVTNLETLNCSDGWLALNDLVALTRIQLENQQLRDILQDDEYLTPLQNGVSYEEKYKQLVLQRMLMPRLKTSDDNQLNEFYQRTEAQELKDYLDQCCGDENQFPKNLLTPTTLKTFQSTINNILLAKEIQRLLGDDKDTPFLKLWFASLPIEEQESLLRDEARLGSLLVSTNREKLRSLMRIKAPNVGEKFNNGYVNEALLQKLVDSNTKNQSHKASSNDALDQVLRNIADPLFSQNNKYKELTKLEIGRFILPFLTALNSLDADKLDKIFDNLSQENKESFLEANISKEDEEESSLLDLIPEQNRQQFKTYLTENKYKELKALYNKTQFFGDDPKTSVDGWLAKLQEDDQRFAEIEKLSKKYFSYLENLYNYSMKWADSAYGLSAKAKAAPLLSEYEKLAKDIAKLRDELSVLNNNYKLALKQFSFDDADLKKWQDEIGLDSEQKKARKDQVAYLLKKQKVIDKKCISVKKMTEQFQRLEEALYGTPNDSKKIWRVGILNHLREAVHYPKMYRSTFAPFTYEDIPLSQVEKKSKEMRLVKEAPIFSVESDHAPKEVDSSPLLPQIPKDHCRLYTGKFGSGGTAGKILEERLAGHGNKEVVNGKTHYADKTRFTAVVIPDDDEGQVEFFLKLMHDKIVSGQHPTVTPLYLCGSEQNIRMGMAAALLLGEVKPSFNSDNIRLGSARVEKKNLNMFSRLTNTEVRLFKKYAPLVENYKKSLEEINRVRYNTKGELYKHSTVKKGLQKVQKKVGETANKMSPGLGG